VDIETASAIEKVTERIDALETSVRGDIAHLRDEMVEQGGQLRGEIAAQGAELRGEISGLREDITGIRGDITGIREDITALRGDITGLRGEITGIHGEITGLRGEIADVRRHAVVLNESTRDDIRLVAEAVAVLTVKVDALRK